jgi:uncharacterized protein (TIRG00374 family)
VVAAIVAGAVAAVYAEQTTMASGVRTLARVSPGWIVAAIGAECASMVAFALMQRRLLRAGGVQLNVAWLLSTAYAANAMAVAIPLIGSGMATGYAYRQYRRRSADPATVGVAITLAGILLTVAFALVVAVAAIASGNPAASAGGLLGALVAVVGIASVAVGLRSPAGRRCLQRIGSAVVGVVQRVAHRPAGDPDQLVGSALRSLSAIRLGSTALFAALMWAIVNWLADAACLIFAIKAVGVPVPWHKVLLVWSAGVGAGSFSPTPAGLGVVDVTMTAALVAAGLHAPDAVAAVLLYRIVTFKVIVSLGWTIRHRIFERGRFLDSTKTASPEN